MEGSGNKKQSIILGRRRYLSTPLWPTVAERYFGKSSRVYEVPFSFIHGETKDFMQFSAYLTGEMLSRLFFDEPLKNKGINNIPSWLVEMAYNSKITSQHFGIVHGKDTVPVNFDNIVQFVEDPSKILVELQQPTLLYTQLNPTKHQNLEIMANGSNQIGG